MNVTCKEQEKIIKYEDLLERYEENVMFLQKSY